MLLLRFFELICRKDIMYEIFEKLCEQMGITPYRFCKDTGVSTSTISTWKNKGTSCGSKLQKIICEYFGVTVDYLMKGEETETKYYLNNETAEMAQKLFENRDLRVLFDAAQDASSEDLKTPYDMLMALKKKERGQNEF